MAFRLLYVNFKAYIPLPKYTKQCLFTYKNRQQLQYNV